MEDDLVKAIQTNPSKCLKCDYFRWCPSKVWIGKSENCQKEKESKYRVQGD